MNLRDLLASFSTDPRKVLNIVISISVVLLVVWLFMMSRMELDSSSAGKTLNPVAQEQADSLSRSEGSRDQLVGTAQRESSGLTFNTFLTFLILLALLGIVWFWSGKKDRMTSERSCKVIGGQVLGQGAQLKIVEINNEIWVIGVTSGTVNLLHRYPKEEWSGPMEKLNSGQNSFKKIFKREM